jgi:Transmembrane domain of unknown function (DUF3566)
MSFAAPTQRRAASTMELKRIDVVSVGKMLAILYLFLGFVFALLMAPATYVDGISFASANRPPHAPPVKPLVDPGLVAVLVTCLVFPVLYALVGIVLGAIAAGMYNFTAKLIGGIKMHFEASEAD